MIWINGKNKIKFNKILKLKCEIDEKEQKRCESTSNSLKKEFIFTLTIVYS